MRKRTLDVKCKVGLRGVSARPDDHAVKRQYLSNEAVGVLDDSGHQ